jgi:BirA family biotin operon repressor/biotin-[acetyl-CoA-carboxylase] ligase
MSEAARRSKDLLRPTWIMAHHQLAGRGRRGRAWLDQSGNLAATLFYRPAASPWDAAKRSFCMANALFEALSYYVPAEKLALKWPNDVLYSGGKIAGILLESAGAGPQVDWLAIGVGVNLATAPEPDSEAKFAPVSLSRDVPPPDPVEFLRQLAIAFDAQEQRMVTYGFDPIRNFWLSRAARLGDVIVARTAKEEITGTFDTIDADGNLVLITAKGPQSIPAADVYF